MGKTFKVRKDKKKKPVNRVSEAIALGTIQLGRAGRHEDKRKKEKYRPRWEEM